MIMMTDVIINIDYNDSPACARCVCMHTQAPTTSSSPERSSKDAANGRVA